MKIIVAMENNKGIMFNHRRVSRDSVVINKISEILQGKSLYVSSYSKSLFNNTSVKCVEISRIEEIEENGYYFIEDININNTDRKPDEAFIFLWNRDYPHDTEFSEEVINNLTLKETEEFTGTSHDKITLQIYR